jgi:hypothetical protein
MTEEQAEKMLELFKNIDNKLADIYNIMKLVLEDSNDNN